MIFHFRKPLAGKSPAKGGVAKKVFAQIVSAKKIFLGAFFALLPLGIVQPLQAGEVDVVDARIVRSENGTFRFDVSLRHADTGWEHYANAFEIVDGEGNVLGARTLVHPHVDEQPFTRSISGVVIPQGLNEVTIRGRDSVHDLGGIEMMLLVPRD